MALVLTNGPDNAPSTSADWDKINDVLQTIGLDINKPTRIKDGYIQRGSVLFFAGAWYVADSDTAVTGVQSDYIKLVNTAGVVAAEYVEALVDVTFNRTWNGWYDPDGNLYLFDEMKALAAGSITELATMREWRPETNWAKALTRNLSTANLNKLFTLDSEVILTGSGIWTVPSGVYYINYNIIGPGNDGGTGDDGGYGGNAGEILTGALQVEPGQNITYNASNTSTIFGSLTALKGAGTPGYPPSNGRGGTGGGYGGGTGGLPGEDGLDGWRPGAGGGGGGGDAGGFFDPGDGGAGALGRIVLT